MRIAPTGSYLSSWSPVCLTVWEVLGHMILLEEVWPYWSKCINGLGYFEVSKSTPVPTSQSFSAACLLIRVQALNYSPGSCMSVCMYHGLCHENHGLTLCHCKQTPNQMFFMSCLGYGVSSYQYNSKTKGKWLAVFLGMGTLEWNGVCSLCFLAPVHVQL